jgi:hypothetical protein
LLFAIGYEEDVEVAVGNGHLPYGHLPYGINPAPADVAPLPSTVNHTHHWPTTYGSVGPGSLAGSLASHAQNRKPVKRKRYRIPFLILLAFDWGLVVFLSVVVMKVRGGGDWGLVVFLSVVVMKVRGGGAWGLVVFLSVVVLKVRGGGDWGLVVFLSVGCPRT